jgi:hypothetical protein
MSNNRSLLIQKAVSEANRYARTKIKIVNTSPETNILSDAKFEILSQKISDFRNKLFTKDPFRLEQNNTLHHFERSLKLSAKEKTGNCMEMVSHGLNYIQLHYPYIYVELYSVTQKNGTWSNHIVGVAGHSTGQHPDEWNDEVYVFDPLINHFFKGNEYLEKLHVFRPIYIDPNKERKLNTYSLFNSREHQFIPIKQYNTVHFKQKRKVDDLINAFYSRVNHIFNTLQTHIMQLEKLANSLNGENEKIIQSKISDIDNFILQTKLKYRKLTNHKYPDDVISYRSVNERLRTMLRKITFESKRLVKLNQEQKTILLLHQDPGSFFTKMMTFFNQPPALYLKADKIQAESLVKLKTR